MINRLIPESAFGVKIKVDNVSLPSCKSVFLKSLHLSFRYLYKRPQSSFQPPSNSSSYILEIRSAAKFVILPFLIRKKPAETPC